MLCSEMEILTSQMIQKGQRMRKEKGWHKTGKLYRGVAALTSCTVFLRMQESKKDKLTDKKSKAKFFLKDDDFKN